MKNQIYRLRFTRYVWVLASRHLSVLSLRL